MIFRVVLSRGNIAIQVITGTGIEGRVFERTEMVIQ